MDAETLIMTATFRAEATPYLVIRQEDVRLQHYLCALVAWSRTKNVQRIVLAENSNTDFDFSNVIRHMERAGKEIEVLVFDGNKEAERLGKGFGEGEILEYVYNNSILLRRNTAFYKVTGRLFVSNFDDVSRCTSSADAFHAKFSKRGKPPKISTTFFKCSLALFGTRLVDAYRQVDEHNGVFIEHVYFNQLRAVDLPDFGAVPALVGQQASTGKIYDAYDEDVIAEATSLADGRAMYQKVAE